MRRLALGVFAAVLLAGCSASIPRHPSVFTPTEPPTAPPTATPAPGTTPAPAFDTSAWVTLAPAGESFSVLMPGQATPATQSVKTPAGDAAVTIWTYTDSSKRSFAVIGVKFGKGALAGAQPKAVLDGMMSALTGTQPGSTVASQTDMTLDGHTGRAVTFGTATITVQSEMFIVGDRMYAVSVGYAAGQPDDGAVQAFIASFKLTV